MKKGQTIPSPFENNSLFQETTAAPAAEKKDPRGRPAKPGYQRSGPNKGLPIELRRFSVIMLKDTANKLFDYAYTKRITVKDALEEMVQKFIADYEADPKNEPLLQKPKD